MVSFLKVVIAAAALVIPAIAQTTPAQVVQNIQLITQKSQDLQVPAQSVNTVNGPLIIIGRGPFPQIIRGFTDIVSTVSVAIDQMQGMEPVRAGSPSDDIFVAFREFVRVHQVILNILIAKAGLLSTVPVVGAPVSAVLRQVEGVIDAFTLILINNVQSRVDDLENQAGSLEMTLTSAIRAYEGLAV